MWLSLQFSYMCCCGLGKCTGVTISSHTSHTHTHTLGSACSLEGFRDPENPHSSQVNSGVEGEAGRIGKAVFRAPLGTWKVIAF